MAQFFSLSNAICRDALRFEIRRQKTGAVFTIVVTQRLRCFAVDRRREDGGAARIEAVLGGAPVLELHSRNGRAVGEHTMRFEIVAL